MIPPDVRIFVCTEPVDMRKGFDGLALAARERLGHDPLAGGLFVFVSRRATRLKILWLDGRGYCLLYKRLHGALFRLPRRGAAVSVQIDARELATLLAGVPRPPRHRRERGLADKVRNLH